MEQEHHTSIKPPKFFLRFFRWYCHPDLLEEIEGDLIERFHKCYELHGTKGAKVFFVKEVIQLFRPSVIGNIHHLVFKPFSTMKRMDWLLLVALNMFVAICIFLPFLPGPHDYLAVAISVYAQATGYFGFLLIPIGALWLIQEIKRKMHHTDNLSLWGNGYYYAITTVVICILTTLFFCIGLWLTVGLTAVAITLAVAGFALYKFIPVTRNLKTSDRPFSSVPLYLLSIPLIAFSVQMFLVGPVSDYSRNYAVKNGERLISAIENYYSHNHRYPETIEELEYVPEPDIMGIEKFEYELKGGSYKLWFVQWLAVGTTREVVMYSKTDKHNLKGHYASFVMDQPHWRYYWFD